MEVRGRRVLVVYLFSGLGDGILLAPVLKALAAAGAKKPIGVLAPPLPASALAHLGLDLRLHRTSEGRAIQRAGYDIAVDLTFRADQDGRGWLARSGAPVRLGFIGPGERLEDTGLTAGRLDRRHYTDRHFSAALIEPLRELGIVAPRYDLPWRVSKDQARRADRLLPRRSKVPRVLLVPGSRSAEKRWPERTFAAIAHHAQEAHRASVVLAGAPRERPALVELARAAGVSSSSIYSGRDLGVLLALIARSEVVVSNDTGPVHFAFLLGVPTLALFSVMSPSAWGPPLPRPNQALVRASSGGASERDEARALEIAALLLAQPPARDRVRCISARDRIRILPAP
ncbi:MAG: glycosyltransferase family 9 protein [Deltaproteobacteria bacterium]|nr:glycosyltransferase family 9 protein [Deltaproteobacteria bacterium]